MSGQVAAHCDAGEFIPKLEHPVSTYDFSFLIAGFYFKVRVFNQYWSGLDFIPGNNRK